MYFIDTSVLLNILAVPQKSQNRTAVMTQLNAYVDNRSVLILPMAAIIETGNHIAHIGDGHLRRSIAQKMSELIEKTVHGEVPWGYDKGELDSSELEKLARQFPDAAMREVGLGDLSIIAACERYRERNGEYVQVHIWSLDKHLQAYG